jgi:hypothetical protein
MEMIFTAVYWLLMQTVLALRLLHHFGGSKTFPISLGGDTSMIA